MKILLSRWILGLALTVGLSLLLGACTRTGQPTPEDARHPKEVDMTTKSAAAAIPPIDTAAPAAVDTATFGLG
jgi:hypothetical protein